MNHNRLFGVPRVAVRLMRILHPSPPAPDLHLDFIQQLPIANCQLGKRIGGTPVQEPQELSRTRSLGELTYRTRITLSGRLNQTAPYIPSHPRSESCESTRQERMSAANAGVLSCRVVSDLSDRGCDGSVWYSLVTSLDSAVH